MSIPIVTLSDIKEFLGKTGTDDDLLIASIASNATAKAERDTGRVFSVTSNTTYRYSTDGQASLVIHDRPYTDATRTVSLNSVALVEGTDVWFLPDRRNQDVTVTVQLRYYDTSSPYWWRRYPNWFDGNLDRYPVGGIPNDLVITGTVGHPAVTGDVRAAVLELASWMYWRAKGGASSYAETLSGTDVDLSLLPQVYQKFVADWKIRTAVMAV